jgi:hypothetical protein
VAVGNRQNRVVRTATVALFVLVWVTLMAPAARSRLARIALLVAAVVWWLAANHPLEGATLVHFDVEHGLTVGDLAALPAVGLAIHAALRSRRDPAGNDEAG